MKKTTEIGGGGIEKIAKWDFEVLDFIQKHLQMSLFDFLFKYFTYLSNKGIIWILFAGVCVCIRGYRRCGISCTAGIVSETIINFLLKQLFKRTRPFFFDVNFKLSISMPKDYSFPSGHTFMAFTVATIIIGYDEKLGLNAYILAILISYSRLYFYVCYPSDVIAGIVFGIALGSLVSYVSHKIYN